MGINMKALTALQLNLVQLLVFTAIIFSCWCLCTFKMFISLTCRVLLLLSLVGVKK